jgi:hypothetical protein
MISVPLGHEFYPQPPDGAGIISWIHFGDLGPNKNGRKW